MKTICLALVLLCSVLSQAYGKTITMTTVATSCASPDANMASTVYTDCFAQLIFDTAANANGAYLFDAALTYYGNGQVIGQSNVGTDAGFISPDDGSCSEVCFTYTSDALANLISFKFYSLYNGCWYCTQGIFDPSGTGENSFSSDTGIDMNSMWSLPDPTPVPLGPAVLSLATAVIGVFCLGRFGRKSLA